MLLRTISASAFISVAALAISSAISAMADCSSSGDDPNLPQKCLALEYNDIEVPAQTTSSTSFATERPTSIFDGHPLRTAALIVGVLVGVLLGVIVVACVRVYSVRRSKEDVDSSFD